MSLGLPFLNGNIEGLAISATLAWSKELDVSDGIQLLVQYGQAQKVIFSERLHVSWPF